MNREAYKLANEIRTTDWADGDCLMEGPEDMDMRRYEATVLNKIRQEKRKAKRTFGKVTAAACAAAVLFTGTAMFGGEVHAAVRRITWSISSALGLSGDLADYRDVIQTPVADQGYVITLQEVVVAEKKLAVNYTVHREDGQPVDQMLNLSEKVYVDGKSSAVAAGGGSSYLDDEQRVLGIELSYEIPDLDPSLEHEFRIEVNELWSGERIRGDWDFAFTADGAELFVDTKRVSIQKEFTLPNGVTVVLEELAMNELEQTITYHTDAPSEYLLQVTAVDDIGNQVEFGTRVADKTSGYMSNEEIIDDGRLADTASSVHMTLNAVGLPKESGQMSHDYIQIGETFELKL